MTLLSHSWRDRRAAGPRRRVSLYWVSALPEVLFTVAVQPSGPPACRVEEIRALRRIKWWSVRRAIVSPRDRGGLGGTRVYGIHGRNAEVAARHDRC